jgi:hypothetical protein
MAIGALLLGALAAAPAGASPVTWAGSTTTLSAAADFAVSGSDLVVTLTNTSSHDVLVPAEVLTAVFFDVSATTLILSPQSATVPAGSAVLFGSAEPGGGVGGEWAYRSGLSGAPGSMAYGISSSGFGLFGPGDRFPGVNLSGSANPGGLDYGILSAGDNPSTGNAPVTGHNGPLIQNQVVFHLGGLPPGFDPFTRITGVTFQYGTSASEPSFPGTVVPSPGSVALLLAGGILCSRRRRASR